MEKSHARCLWVIKAGLIHYVDAWHLQRELSKARLSGTVSDTLLLLQHPPTITLGRGARKENLLATEDELRNRGMACFPTDRGGDVTYHGPGQLVGYPVIKLPDHDLSVSQYVRRLEDVLLATLAEVGVTGQRLSGLVGVWAAGYKVAALGIKVSRGITTHGFALNVNNDLTPFRCMHPCGLRGVQVTSVSELVGSVVSVGEIEEIVINQFRRLFHLECSVIDRVGPVRD